MLSLTGPLAFRRAVASSASLALDGEYIMMVLLGSDLIALENVVYMLSCRYHTLQCLVIFLWEEIIIHTVSTLKVIHCSSKCVETVVYRVK